ncbi:hypothetical protein [Pectobacterium parvum]|uniref:capsular polysaccharide export protein, LipB/KpsS family n=1 Tax=Pectobacterium parvum TaxID=2778550 RepID=UPI00137499B6|nr:hypothetical protein [Pectobacterium parvum]
MSARKKTLGEKIEIFNDYAFLPLQVSSDSQLLLNSDVDNISAIKISMDYCNEKKLELLIKIHPAESDGKKIEEYTLMSKVYGFRLVTNNTFELIKNAKIVITINSTVGLESKMFNIDTLFLGRSFYDKLNGDLLEDYIQRYLFDADYFGENIIDFNLIKKHYNHIKKISKG